MEYETQRVILLDELDGLLEKFLDHVAAADTSSKIPAHLLDMAESFSGRFDRAMSLLKGEEEDARQMIVLLEDVEKQMGSDQSSDKESVPRDTGELLEDTLDEIINIREAEFFNQLSPELVRRWRKILEDLGYVEKLGLAN